MLDRNKTISYLKNETQMQLIYHVDDPYHRKIILLVYFLISIIDSDCTSRTYSVFIITFQIVCYKLRNVIDKFNEHMINMLSCLIHVMYTVIQSHVRFPCEYRLFKILPLSSPCICVMSFFLENGNSFSNVSTKNLIFGSSIMQIYKFFNCYFFLWISIGYCCWSLV